MEILNDEELNYLDELRMCGNPEMAARVLECFAKVYEEEEVRPRRTFVTLEMVRQMRGLYSCDEGHEEIFYLSDECPVCLLIEKLSSVVNDL